MGMGIDEAYDPPGEAVVHLVSPFCNHPVFRVDKKAYMAGSAGRSCEILSKDPGDCLEIPILAKGGEDIPMFADLINTISGDVRTFMALGAGMGFSCHLNGKLVPGMAGSARALTSVRIDPANPLVGPSREDWEFHLPHARFF